ncbi:MAG TPA: TIGR02587 family membrane protein [Pyrinomonadaceae bacterium]|nr:TIGR02587 family membrane protein [Pyrinomonadaceae bacterium]
MIHSSRDHSGPNAANHSFGVDLAHDFGGAIIFSFPLLMTMEMWWLGFYMDRFRLSLFLTLAFILVIGLSYLEGRPESFKIEILDALVAWTAGFVVASVMLILFGIIKQDMSANEIVGKISLHAIPGSIGAILARKLLEVEETPKERQRREAYFAKIFLMGAGAIFLAFQLAPTEEMVLIGHRMTGWHAAALVVVSLGIMQAFNCSVEYREGGGSVMSAKFLWGVFLRFTVVGYSVALLISLYVLWTFGRLDGAAISETIRAMVVLGFPAALGTSAARLIL